MKIQKILRFFVILCLFSLAEAKEQVFVSIPPLKNMVSALLKDVAEVNSILRVNEIPHNWQPTPQRMKSLIGAKAILLTGLGFEKKLLMRLPEIKNSKTYLMWQGQDFLSAHRHETEDHEHEHEEEAIEETLESFDPHLWNSPKRLLASIDGISKYLKVVFVKDSLKIQKNSEALKLKYQKLDTEVSELLKPYKGKEVFFYHPAFNYLAHDYGIKVVELEKEGKMPGTKTLIEILDKIKESKIKRMWIQPQYSLRKFSGILKDYDLTVAIADPLEPELESNILKVAKGWAEEISKRAP